MKTRDDSLYLIIVGARTATFLICRASRRAKSFPFRENALDINHCFQCLARREKVASSRMLSALPEELLVAELELLDAVAACRLSQVDKAFQQWICLHHEEWVHAWRHARAWLKLCERAQARVQHRWAIVRGRSVVWNHFTPLLDAVNRVRCCCTEGVANGNACGKQLVVNGNTGPLWKHLLAAHPTLYDRLRAQ